MCAHYIFKYTWIFYFYVGLIGALFPFLSYGATSDVDSLKAATQEISQPTIHYEMTSLPQAVFATRQRIIDAAKTGEIENLRPLLMQASTQTQIHPNEQEGDPIAFLRDISGDGEGLEILAILLNLLQSGYVIIDDDNLGELYVWPYFVALPLEGLSKTQKIEIYQLMTTGDFDVMQEIGRYTFFRLAIASNGQWHFFFTGD